MLLWINRNKKQTGIPVLIVNKMDFRTKLVRGERKDISY